MIKACIFDLDGTLADTVESIAHGVNHTIKCLGFAPRPVEEYNFYAGDGIDLALKRALIAAGDEKCLHLNEGIPITRDYFDSHALYHVTPYPEIPVLLRELKERGIMMAVLSNKPHEAAIFVVTSIFGKDTFDWIQGQSDEVPKKPDPTGALTIAKRFGVNRNEVLYFGDTNTDMKTGKAAKMFTVGVTWGFRPRKELEDNHADAIIDSPLQILKLLE